MISLLVLDALYKCFSFSELSMTMALSVFTLSILQGKLMKHSSQATYVLCLLSRKTQPFRAIMKCVMWKLGNLPAAYYLYSDLKLSLRPLSSTKMSKAFSSGDSAHVIVQSKETAHPKQRYKTLNTWVREVNVNCTLKTWKLICKKHSFYQNFYFVGKLFSVLIYASRLAFKCFSLK